MPTKKSGTDKPGLPAAYSTQANVATDHEGESYIKVRRRSFASRGVSSVLPPELVGCSAAQHVLSDLEAIAVLHVRSLHAQRVRTQVPLQIHNNTTGHPGTLSIAERLGYRHPVRDGAPSAFTTDLVVTSVGGETLPLYVKHFNDVPRPLTRAQELQQIEAEYWSLRGAQLRLYTEQECPPAERKLLRWASDGLLGLQRESNEFIDLLRSTRGRLQMSTLFGQWPSGVADGICNFKHCIGNGRVCLVQAATPPTIHSFVHFRLRTDADLARLLSATCAHWRAL